MKVALWAEIRRLSEIEKLSGRVIARQRDGRQGPLRGRQEGCQVCPEGRETACAGDEKGRQIRRPEGAKKGFEKAGEGLS